MEKQLTCKLCKKRGLLSKTIAFIIAILSKRDTNLADRRIIVCTTYNRVKFDMKTTFVPCEKLVKKDNGDIFCGECGCPQSGPMSYFSELKRKAGYSKSECPLERWE